MSAWRTAVRRGGRRWRDRRHRDGVRARAVGRAHAARRPGRRRAGPPTPAPGSCRPRRRSATTRVGSISCSRPAGTTRRWSRSSIPTTVGPAAASCSSRRVRPTCRRGSGSPSARRARREISADEARRDGPGARARSLRALHHPRAARVDGRMMCARAAARRRAATAWRCAPVRSTRCAPGSTGDGRDRRRGDRGRRGGDRGRCVDARASASSSACSYRSVPLRGQIAHLGVAEHDTGDVADRATGVRPLHGAVGRSPRRGRRDGRRRGLRRRRDRGRRQRDHARGAARDARPRGRDAGRGARRPAPDERRRLAAARSAARDRQRVRRHRPRRQRPAARPDLRKARRRPDRAGQDPRPRPHPLLTSPFPKLDPSDRRSARRGEPPSDGAFGVSVRA